MLELNYFGTEGPSLRRDRMPVENPAAGGPLSGVFLGLVLG
jgi:hypothetical protein